MVGKDQVQDDGEVYLFKQKKDHFDPNNAAMFEQRYFFNSTFHKKRGPVFFMLGQEGPSSPSDVDHGLANYLAQEFGALVVELEHRYYGKGESMPVSDLSTKNLQWLSAEQALEDFVYFRRSLPDLQPDLELHEGDDWIVFGCSYAGAMSSWLRMKYPHLFLSAIGGSGPVHAKVNFPEYDETVSYSLGLDSEECHLNSQAAMAQAGDMTLSQQNWATLEKTFNTCTPIVNPLDFIDTIYNPLAFSVQYNEAHLNYPRNTLCEIMTNKSQTPLDNLAQANSDPRLGNPPGCLQIELYHGSDGLLNTSTSVEMRKWMWQTCTEFGYYQTAADSPNNTMSPLLNVTYFLDMCAKTFGDEFTSHRIREDIDATNDRYGARDPSVTNVLYPNGFEDPWSTLGVKRMLQPSDMPVLYRGAGHCAPYYDPMDTETPSVKESRDIIVTWLKYLFNEAE